jgi:hypothetical protein
LFVDPMADIAILGAPNEEEMSKEYEAYRVGWGLHTIYHGSDGQGPWQTCHYKHFDGPLWLSDARKGIVGGMSRLTHIG